MHGRRAICHARNALCPSTALSHLFNIPLARRSPAVKFSTRRPKDGDAQTLPVDKSSLAVTLEAHRRTNRDSLIRRSTANAVDDMLIFRPALPLSRFTQIEQEGTGDETKHWRTKIRKERPKTKKERPKTKKPFKSRVSIESIGAKNRESPPLDYVGEYVEPLYDRKDVKDEGLPWFAASQLPNATALERLSAELKAFHDYLLPTPDERAGRAAVVVDTVDVFSRRQKPHNESTVTSLELFGSERSGLAFATSDLDLRIYRRYVESAGDSDAKQAPRFDVRRRLLSYLIRLCPAYQNHDKFILAVFRHSRYPLLSMQHAESGIDVQIVCSNDTSEARSLMAQYMEKMPALAIVYTAFKYLLEIRGLMDVFRGGIGSYSMFYMLVAGMEFGPQPAKDDPATQLLAILNFYAKFDTYTKWISLDPLEIRPKIEKKPVQSVAEKEDMKVQMRIGLQDDRQPYLLCLRDPADATNDLGRKTFGWKHLQATMETLREELQQRIEKDDQALLLPSLVGRGFDMFEAKREKLAAFGRKSSVPTQSLERLVETQQEVEVQQEAIETQQEAEVQQEVEMQQEAIETQQEPEVQQEAIETPQEVARSRE